MEDVIPSLNSRNPSQIHRTHPQPLPASIRPPGSWPRRIAALSLACASSALAEVFPPAFPVPAVGEPATGSVTGLPPEERPETLLPDWGGVRERLALKGFQYAITYTGEVLGNVSGGLGTGAVYEGLLKTSLDFDTERLGGWSGGLWHVCGLYPHGSSLSQKYVGDLFTFSNIDAPDSPRLFEFWYEHQILPDTLSLRIGQLAADEEFAGTDYGCLFINGTCGWPALLGVNTPSPAYPVGTPGLRIQADLDPGWTLRAALYNGDAYPANDDGSPKNIHGTYLEWRDAFALAEISKAWNSDDQAHGLPGLSKFGFWYHSGRFDDLRLDDSGLSLANPNTTGTPRSHRGQWGLYATAEQQVWREDSDHPDQGLGIFARIGGTPGDRSLLHFYAEGGLTYTGLLPGRDQDGIGVAFVYGEISRDARNLTSDSNQITGASDPVPDYEMVVESTYRLVVRSGVTVQPVASFIFHPGGFPGNDALVLGLRAILDF